MTVSSRLSVRPFLDSPQFAAASGAEHDAESFLARARAFLALSSFLAIEIDPVFPPQLMLVAYAGVSLYIIHSLLVLISARYRRRWMSGLTLHVIDLLWVGGFPVFIQGPNRGLFLLYPFLLFILLAAAYRWGLYETIVTGAACVPLLAAGDIAITLAGPPYLPMSFAQLSSKDVAVGVAALFMTAYVVGYLGEQERNFRAKASVIARFTEKVYSETTVRETMEAALGAILSIFGANRAALVVREEKQQRAFLWQVERIAGTQKCALNWEELETFQQQRYLFSLPGTSCYAIRRPERRTRSYDLLAVGGRWERLGRGSYDFPDYFLAWHKFTSLLVVSFTVGEGTAWSGRLFLFDPGARARQAELRFLQDLVHEAGAAVYTVYRLRRLRSRAGGLERARIARELHDQVIQTLIAVEMRMNVLLRHVSLDPVTVDELTQLQRLLRQEILNVRALIQQAKPADLGPGTFLDNVAELVRKFQRDTGISAILEADSKEVALSPALSREVLRIVGEALANVWKHSGANNVVVRFASRNGPWKLVIEDDGRGFGFSGRLSQAELDAARKAPAVIKERVRAIGGELAVESAPGRGARVEITFAQQQT